MKIFAVQKIGSEIVWDMEDEQIKGFFSREEAETRVKNLNKGQGCFEVVEIEVAESDIEIAETSQSYEQFKQLVDETNKKKLSLMKNYLLGESKKIFAKYPKLKSFGWTQYTPYFNDGDACYFGVNSDCPYINGEHCEDMEEKQYKKWGENTVKSISELIGSIDDDDLAAVFEDHVMVTIHRSGRIEVEEYSHD